MANVLIAGCGYVGTALGQRLVLAGDTVHGLRRRPQALPAGIRPIEADLAVAATLRDLPPRLEKIVYAASPGGGDDAHYRTAYVEGLTRLLEALDAQGQRPLRIILVGSTSVYGQSRGEWVDEDSPTEPEHFRGRRLLEAERVLAEGPFPGTVLRLGGIYGPRRTGLVERVRSGRATYLPHVEHFTNRIHRDDAAGALQHLLGLDHPEARYLGVDDEPADEAVVLRWLAGALGAPAPRPESGPDAKARRSRGSKRCRNARLRGSGYALVYPTFREGYTALLAEMR